MKQENKTAGP